MVDIVLNNIAVAEAPASTEYVVFNMSRVEAASAILTRGFGRATAAYHSKNVKRGWVNIRR